MKKGLVLVMIAMLIIALFCGTVAGDENYNDHSYEGDSPNAQGDIQHPDDTGGEQQRSEPRTRNKDA